MRILVGGPLFRWNTTEARRRAFSTLGHEVAEIDVLRFVDPSHNLLPAVRRHLHFGIGTARYNEQLLSQASEWKPDLVWLELPSQVWPKTVRALRSTGAMVVDHHAEYVGHQRYWYRHLLAATALYDAHVVTNELTAEILKRRGAGRVIVSEFGYDPDLHRPTRLSQMEAESYRTDAVFVGHWEPRTARFIAHLRKAGVGVTVYGPNWQRAYQFNDRRRIRPIYGEDYVRALTGAKICLCFLSRWNHNQATWRTFEIPATGGFLMADRTPLHRSYFEEGKEAEFFSSAEELVEKCRYYLANPEARVAVARAGHEQCIRSGHTHEDEVRRILSQLRVGAKTRL